jgi:hypothetical protein
LETLEKQFEKFTVLAASLKRQVEIKEQMISSRSTELSAKIEEM